MADQVNPTGSLATGPPQTLIAAAKPQMAAEPPRPAKATESRTQKPDGRQASAKATDADLEAINKGLQQTNSNLEFRVDKATGITYFKVVNSTTGEVIRQVPTEEALTLARKLRELSHAKGASGVLMDKEG